MPEGCSVQIRERDAILLEGVGGRRKSSAIVLVAANLDLSEELSDILADADIALLQAQSKQEAIAMLGLLKSQFDLAIIDLGLPDFDGWDLIEQLTRPPGRAVKTIAATSAYSEELAKQIRQLGADAVVPRAIAPQKWRRVVEAALLE